jgi:sugar fermentation stimulation protein A
MRFPEPLIPGTLIRRYNRFLSDIELAGGENVVAHCANPGSMLGLNAPGSEVWVSKARNPSRKLRYSWELVRVNGHLVGINASVPNILVEEALHAGKIPELAGYPSSRREVRYGRNSRIDLLLEGDGRPKCFVEVKNVHLKRGPSAAFPDAVTVRGTKHLHELIDMAARGARAVMLYVVQRGDCDSFTVAADIDPRYAEALKQAREKGVEAICYGCNISLEGIEMESPLPLAL